MKKILASVLCALLLSAQPLVAAPINKVAAVVNGKVITMFDLQRQAMSELIRARIDPTSVADGKRANAVLRKELDEMILTILINEDAKRLKIEISDADVDAEITRMYTARGMTKEQFEKILARDKVSLSDIRENFRNGMTRQRVMAMEVMRRVIVTPEEVKAYYDQHKDSMYKRDGVNFALIVYHPQFSVQKIARQVRSGQISWLEASRRYSIVPNRNAGGDQGPIMWDRLNDEWRQRFEKMQPGEISELFVFDRKQNLKGQVRMFRPNTDQQTPFQIMTLDEARPIIDGILRGPKAEERFKDYAQQLRNKAVIDIRM